jgi:cell division protein FtsW (lipid II flippase)
MRLLQLWFGVDWPIFPQQLLGVVALLAPLLWRRRHDVGERWQLRYVASVLIFCVLFNHQAEPASFVIAMTGIAVWFSLEERRWWTWLVLALVVLGTMVVGSGALPATLRSRLFDLKIKTVPVLLVWIILQIQLWAGKRAATPLSVSSS